MKNPLFPIAILLLVCIPISCTIGTSNVKQQPTETYIPKFSFTPPKVDKVGSDITFAVTQAIYSSKEEWTQYPPFTTIATNMGQDLQKILIARGFTVRGPFRSYDEMTFPEKKGSDLILYFSLDWKLNPEISPVDRGGFLGVLISTSSGSTYSFDGTATISGRVFIKAVESLSNENMWTKTIDLPVKQFDWTGEKTATYKKAPNNVSEDFIFRDPGFLNVAGPILDDYYQKIMQAAWSYIDPEEMKIIKKQALEIRQKKVY